MMASRANGNKVEEEPKGKFLFDLVLHLAECISYYINLYAGNLVAVQRFSSVFNCAANLFRVVAFLHNLSHPSYISHRT